MSRDLARLADALGEGATAVTPGAARDAAAYWAEQTRAAGLDAVADGLDALLALLGADRLDGRAIAARLRQLGEATAATSTEDDALGATLARLGGVLVRTATMLGG